MAVAEPESDSFDVRWSYVHATVVLLAVAGVAWLKLPALLALGAGLSFAVFLAGSRGSWTPGGSFGLANLVTSGRLVITAILLFELERPRGVWLGVSACIVLALDVLDGYLARRFRFASEFGARFDVESDAFFVMTLAVLLWSRGITGSWIFIAGLWRYFYLLAPLIVPTSAGEAKRSRFGRFIYVVLVLSFVTAFVLPPELGAPAAAFGTLAVSFSFLRSFWERYKPAAP